MNGRGDFRSRHRRPEGVPIVREHRVLGKNTGAI